MAGSPSVGRVWRPLPLRPGDRRHPFREHLLAPEAATLPAGDGRERVTRRASACWSSRMSSLVRPDGAIWGDAGAAAPPTGAADDTPNTGSRNKPTHRPGAA